MQIHTYMHMHTQTHVVFFPHSVSKWTSCNGTCSRRNMFITFFFFSWVVAGKGQGSTREAHDVTCKTGRLSWPNMTGRPVLNPADKVQNIHFSQFSFALSPKNWNQITGRGVWDKERSRSWVREPLVSLDLARLQTPLTCPLLKSVGERDRMNKCFWWVQRFEWVNIWRLGCDFLETDPCAMLDKVNEQQAEAAAPPADLHIQSIHSEQGWINTSPDNPEVALATQMGLSLSVMASEILAASQQQQGREHSHPNPWQDTAKGVNSRPEGPSLRRIMTSKWQLDCKRFQW